MKKPRKATGLPLLPGLGSSPDYKLHEDEEFHSVHHSHMI